MVRSSCCRTGAGGAGGVGVGAGRLAAAVAAEAAAACGGDGGGLPKKASRSRMSSWSQGKAWSQRGSSSE